jgi:acetylornithine deacetylase/succinyl-diaminopimelate desuccinylase-like protein
VTEVPVAGPRVALTAEQESWAAAAADAVDVGRLRELVVAMTSIPSPTGDEAALATWLAATMAAAGLSARTLALDERQADTLGRVGGDGSGATLMLYAPIDTLTVGTTEEDVPWIGPELRPDERPGAVIDGPLVTGLGASNPKGHGACVLAAVEAVAAVGVPLRGDLLAGFGAGGMPTNARGSGGRRATGQGAGCSFLLEQGAWPDAAVIAKPGWTASWEEVGLAWIEVRVRGTHTYVGSRHRLPFRSAIVDAATVIGGLEAWFPTYTARHTTATCAPQVIVGAIEGGWWRMAAVSPSLCRFLVDVRIPPGTTPAQAAHEVGGSLAAVAAQHGIDAESELVVAIPGTRTPPDAFVVEAAVEAWEHAEGRPHEVITANSGATDANILRSRGVPTVRIGMPKVAGITDFQLGMNTVDTEEMVRLTRALARIAVNVCTRPRRDVAGCE